MSNATSKAVLALVLVALVGGAWFFVRAYMGPGEQTQYATVLPSPMDFRALSLTDQEGDAFTRESLKGNWSLLYFGFTRCPDVCPATMQILAVTRDRLAAQGLPESILPKIVLISVDPDRDTADVLKSYVSYFGEDIIGLTSNRSELRKLTKQPGILIQESLSDDGYSVDHPESVFVINPNAKLQAFFIAPHSVDALVHDLPLILAFK